MRLLDDKLMRRTDAGFDLVGQHCANCGKIAFPRKRVCPVCFSSDLGDHVLSRSGTLHTFTTTHLGPPVLPAPYTIGFLDLPEGIKLMGLIRIAQPAAEYLEIGMRMDIVLDRLRTEPDGDDIYCYMFAPAGGEELS